MIIIGAGMAGLLAANLLRHRSPLILEAQEALPNNHSAVLRFRSPEIGDLLHIPFKKVKMIKASVPWLNPVADAMAYSRKVSGTSRSDRSISSITPETHDRWIAPPDFIPRMAKGLDIRYQVSKIPFDTKVLSTIPMPSLLDILDYPTPLKFGYITGYNIRARLENVDAYVSLYVPNPDYLFNRISITGDELIIEFSLSPKAPLEVNVDHIGDALELLGMKGTKTSDVEVKVQKYQKILPIDEEERKKAIYWASTIKGKAWQLGRYATWRPGLLMDDLVKDIRKIDRWIADGGAAPYEMEKHHARSGSI